MIERDNLQNYEAMNQSNREKRIALAHDFLTTWGGAERVFKVMTEMYPEAPIYTLYYDPAFVRKYFPGRTIRASFLQKLPRWLRTSTFVYPLYPVAVETLDLRDFDTVLSSSGAWMKGLVTRLHTRHIAYLHSPMRYVWDTFHSHPKLRSGFHFLKRLLLSYLRLWDKEAADRPDVLLVNSLYTQERVTKYYRRESVVVYPPVTLRQSDEVLSSTNSKQSFLVVARLTPAKNIDVVIEAFNKLALPLTIVGAGPEEKHLRQLAAKHITFAGKLDDRELVTRYREARALIQPSEEDFGLVAAEALCLGTPVIAYRPGAVREVVVEGKTGELFDDLVPESVADGVRRFIECEKGYDKSLMLATGDKYSREHFEALIRAQIE